MNKKSPWAWIPSLYFSEGLPYVLVMSVSVIMYKKLGISNADIALYTSWLYLPWVIKPFWSPLVEALKTKRWWIISMQVIIGAALAGIAFTIPTDSFFQWSLACFWLLAFSSATHDIAIDGFYMYALSKHDQTYFIGIRSTFYRIAMISGQGLLIIIAGYLEKYVFIGKENQSSVWFVVFIIVCVIFFLFSIYHRYILPKPNTDNDDLAESFSSIFYTYKKVLVSFFKKKNLFLMLAMLLSYRLGESLLVKMASPFLLDSAKQGGLALSTLEVGIIYGTIGLVFLSVGGILGGYLASKHGLKYWLWFMVAAINIPNVVYVYLAYFLPNSFVLIAASVAIEQFGYGFGFTAYMLYLIYISEGEYKTAHFAFGTGIMALGMMIPAMVSGYLQEFLGYKHFFIFVLCSCIPSFIVVYFLKIPSSFGIKTKE